MPLMKGRFGTCRGQGERDLLFLADFFAQRHQGQRLIQRQVYRRHEKVLPDMVAATLLIVEKRNVGALQQR